MTPRLTDAQRVLVEEHQGLVYACVRDCFAPAIYALAEPEDVIQTGMLGLIRAAQSYNPDRHIRFATYAWACIRNYIRTWRQHLLHRSHNLETRTMSLDRTIYADNGITLGDVLPSGEDVEATAHAHLELYLMRRAAEDAGLARQYDMLLRHAGGETMAEIGRSLGVSKQAVDKGMRRVRALLTTESGPEQARPERLNNENQTIRNPAPDGADVT